MDDTNVQPQAVTRLFTFGYGQTCPHTGEDLGDHYALVSAPDASSAKLLMMAAFGRNWAFEYDPSSPHIVDYIPRMKLHAFLAIGEGSVGVGTVVADPTGLDHSRADDGEDPQQIGKRVEPHTGGVKSGIATDGHRVGDPVITGDLAGPKGWHRKGCHGATGLPCTCEPTHCGCGGELHEGVCVSCGSAVRAVASES